MSLISIWIHLFPLHYTILQSVYVLLPMVWLIVLSIFWQGKLIYSIHVRNKRDVVHCP
jgi:hypothetical protein